VSVEIGLRSTADADELHSIYRRIFGDTKAATRRTTWSWQYERNPQSPSGPVVYVARRDAHALGQMGTMPVSLWWGDREVRAAWGIDYFVSPDAEGQGHSIALAKAWMQGVDVALALGLAETSYLICRRLGFADLGFVPFYQAILDPGAIAGKRYGTLAGRLAAPLTVAMRLVRKTRRPLPADMEVRDAEDIGRGLRRAVGDRADRLRRLRAAGCRLRALAIPRDAAQAVRDRGITPPRRAHRLCRDTARGLQRAATGLDRRPVHRRRGSRQPGCAADHRDAALRACRRRARAGAVHEPRARREPQAPWFFAGEARGHLCARANEISLPAFTDAGRWHVVFGDGDWDR
jgi:hypothetical protein